MDAPTFPTDVPTPDVANLKQSEVDDLIDKLRDALKLRVTDADVPDGYYKFTSGLTTLLMGLYEEQSKRLKELRGDGSDSDNEPVSQPVSTNQPSEPWMDDLLSHLLGCSREETNRAMRVISERTDELRKVKEELKQVKEELKVADDNFVKLKEELKQVKEWGGDNFVKLKEELKQVKESTPTYGDAPPGGGFASGEIPPLSAEETAARKERLKIYQDAKLPWFGLI